jgi:NADH-quinone oxidoreductase subunit G
MATLYVDGERYDAEMGDNLLRACLSLGFDIPYFCWHPAMGSVGACRQCAVKQFRDEKDVRGRIVMSCLTPLTDDVRISVKDPEAIAFRSSVIEWLMTNHPHDCPVCEEGGECHLQDMTLMTGHVYRRYRFKKRTHKNQYLGPFLTHEMNRCIACYRCVRFYRDYAGGRDFDVFAIHRNVYFGRHEDGVLENEFSGNLAEVCPTGVFDDKPFAEVYNRKWDLAAAPSLCIHCGVGCNTTLNERCGKVRRVVNRYNSEINGYFLCDRGRFGRGFLDAPGRIRQALLRRSNEAVLEYATTSEALERFAQILSYGKAIGIGSPRASLEANFVLRELVGAENFYLGVSELEQQLTGLILTILRDGPARAASLKDAEEADAVFVLGEDVANTAPRLALALRQAARHRALEIAESLKIPRWQDAGVREATRSQGSPFFIATPDATRIDDVATRTYRAAADDIARLGFAVAHAIDAAAPPVDDLPDEIRAFAGQIAEALKQAKRPLIVSGSGCASRPVIEATANIAWALRQMARPAGLYLAVPECNSMGLGLMGGGTLRSALSAVQASAAETLIVVENDLYRRADANLVDNFFQHVRHVVVLDHVLHDTARKAAIVLPAGTFAEADGALVNSEGRAQRYFRVLAPDGEIRESWRWLNDVLSRTGRAPHPPWSRLDDVIAACAAAIPSLALIVRAAPTADFRVSGSKIARQPHRYSGRTAIDAAKTVHEPKPPDDRDTPFSYSMEGYYGPLPSAVVPYFWAPGWNSVRALNKFQDEVGGPLRGGDPGVRLIEPQLQAMPCYFGDAPPAFEPRREEWLIAPLYEIFGSEELSGMAPAVSERVPAPYLALNEQDAARLHVADGAVVAVSIDEAIFRLPVKLRPALPQGVAGAVIGLSGSLAAHLPVWAKISARGTSEVKHDG